MVPFTSSLSGTLGELGMGVSGQISEHISLFATVSHERSLDNKEQESWGGRLGISVRWQIG